MRRQLFFLDTEFTSFHEPALISIALAASSGEEFYAEVPYVASACSPFVKEVVVPLLGRDRSDLCDYDNLATRLQQWFAVVRNDTEAVVCFDSSYDEAMFRQIFDHRPPSFLRFRNIGESNVSELLRHEFHVKNLLPEHHALNDARALRYAFRESTATL